MILARPRSQGELANRIVLAISSDLDKLHATENAPTLRRSIQDPCTRAFMNLSIIFASYEHLIFGSDPKFNDPQQTYISEIES